MMNKFIKLTPAYGGGAIYLAVDKIVSILTRLPGTDGVEVRGANLFCANGEDQYTVEESPEQILQLINDLE